MLIALILVIAALIAICLWLHAGPAELPGILVSFAKRHWWNLAGGPGVPSTLDPRQVREEFWKALIADRWRNVKQLVGMGAAPNASHPELCATPLYLAALAGRRRMVETLLDCGADPNIRTAGAAPIHIATVRGQARVLRALASKGADINCRNDQGMAPLHYAAFRRDARTAELLIQLGVEVNARDNFGNTPLHHLWRSRSGLDPAAGSQSDFAETLSLLLASGADPKAYNDAGEDPERFLAGVLVREYERRMTELLRAGTIDDRRGDD
jgi:cytohesin